MEAIIQLIKNLRRGDEMETSKEKFFRIVPEKLNDICIDCSMRDLVSIVDTYADHGTETQRAQALIISTFVNLVKISDTFLQYATKIDSEPQPESNGVFHLYDGINSLRIRYDDMSSVLFFRIKMSLTSDLTLFAIFSEIVTRLAKHSKTLKMASRENEYFFEPEFFPGRKNFLGLEYNNKKVKELDILP